MKRLFILRFRICAVLLQAAAALLCATRGQAQSMLPLDGWRLHVPYQQGKAVAYAGDKVYLAAQQGLFYYDKKFNATQPLSKTDGLREQQISALAYDAATETLIIAYKNAAIDLLRGNEIIHISDIYRKPVQAETFINSIYTYNKLAYFSTSAGVVVLDLQRLEIRETYSYPGPEGAPINVQATAILGDSIFLATDTGMLTAQLTGTNLQDFRSWANINTGLEAQVNSLAVFDRKLYAGTPAQGVYTWQGQSWQPVPASINAAVNTMSASENHLVITHAKGISLLDKSGRLVNLNSGLLPSPEDAVAGEDGAVWAADANNGLVRIDLNSNATAAFAPNGPFSNQIFRLYAAQGRVYAMSGGYNNRYQPQGSYNGFYVYAGGNWQSFNKYTYPNPTALVPAADLVDAVYNPITDKLYFASYGSGLLEWKALEDNKLYNASNSPLPGITTETESIRVTSLAVDAAGNVWVVNRSQQLHAPALHALQPDGTWRRFILPDVANGSNLDQVLIDDAGRKWLSVAREQNFGSGLVVFDEKENQVRQLRAGEGRGGLPHSSVYSMASDLNGDIWVGTASGVGVFHNPATVFEAQAYDARLPLINRRPLLDGQTVRSIAVDGANRKWMGTGNGLWLFSAGGDELIHHFTSKNSPLPSDNVLSVAVEHQSGEVFVATDAGVASYRAGATITEGTPDCAVVFPNPVRRDFTGLVGISGLPNNADVRITDVAGTLVYKTQATGGTLAWNVCDYNGRRVKAGVYLVLSASMDGKQTCITKIAVLQ